MTIQPLAQLIGISANHDDSGALQVSPRPAQSSAPGLLRGHLLPVPSGCSVTLLRFLPVFTLRLSHSPGHIHFRG